MKKASAWAATQPKQVLKAPLAKVTRMHCNVPKVLSNPSSSKKSRPPLSIREVAETIGRSERHVRDLIEAGQLAAFNTTVNPRAKKPRYRVLPEAVDVWIQSRAIGTPPQPTATTKACRKPVRRYV